MSASDFDKYLNRLAELQAEGVDNVSLKVLNNEWRLLVKLSKVIKDRKTEVRRLISDVRPDSEPLPLGRPKNNEQAIAMIDLYKQGKSLQEIGAVYGVSREWVRQVLKRMGVTRKDGGVAVRTRKICKGKDCDNPARTMGYCSKHYARVRGHGTPEPIFKNEFHTHEDICLVEGCDKPFKAYGLCNKHRTSFYLNRRAGNISDLNDFLKTQKAKWMMGKTQVRFEVIREFMAANKEQFVIDLYEGRY